jgi:hypothetical protein
MSAAHHIRTLVLIALAHACSSGDSLVGPGSPIIAGLAIQPNPILVGSGSVVGIKVIGSDSNGRSVDYDKRQLHFVSSDSAVAIPHVGSCVDGDCGFDHPDELVAARPGSAIITASLMTTHGALTATASVTVTTANSEGAGIPRPK